MGGSVEPVGALEEPSDPNTVAKKTGNEETGGDFDSPHPTKLSDAEFEALVESALDRIPAELMEAVENCAIIVEHEPPGDQPGLLGLYQGQPLTDRGEYAGAIPDTITIYQGPLQRLFPNPDQLEQEVYRTVVHEIGHYFGFEEDQLHHLGWG